MPWQVKMSGSVASAHPIPPPAGGSQTHPTLATGTSNSHHFLCVFAPVSVGPSGFHMPSQAGSEAGAPTAPANGEPPGGPEPEKQASYEESNRSGVEPPPAPPPSRHGGIAAAAVATVAAGRIGAGVARGWRRGYSEFSDQARVRVEDCTNYSAMGPGC